MKLLLVAPQYRPNLSSMVRSAEFFGWKELYIYDTFDLLAPPTNKKQRADRNHMARVWTAGAVDHIQLHLVTQIGSFLEAHQTTGGRVVGTLVDPSAQPLHQFPFLDSDLVLFGNERDGLPPEVLAQLDASVYIAGFGQTDCLNVAVSFGIVLQEIVAKK